MKAQVFEKLSGRGLGKLCTDKVYNAYYRKACRIGKGRVNPALKVDLIVQMIVKNEQ